MVMGGKQFLACSVATFLAAAFLTARPAGAQVLYGIDQASPTLGIINTTDGSTLSTVGIILAGQTVNGGTGLAVDPTSGVMYAVLKIAGQPTRQLVTIDPSTGIATNVGDTGDNFAGLAFDSAGTLYGVTGDGAITPSTLFTIDKTSAATSLFLPLGNGTDGEAIAFNPDDGLLYHASGHSGDGDVIFESINLSTLAITDIPIAGTALVDEEVQALAYYQPGGTFFWKQFHGSPGPLFSVTTSGVPTLLGDADVQWKGLAFVGPAAAVPEPGMMSLVACGGIGLLPVLRRRR